MGRTLRIETPRVLLPMLRPSRYKALWGGRGAMKSHFFAELMIETHLQPGERSVCIREVQRSLELSVKQLLADKIKTFGLSSLFQVKHTHIETPGHGLIIFEGMQNHTADTIRSLEGFNRAWVEEAHSLSQRSLNLLRPTIRRPGSEIWLSWNPRFATDPVDALMRQPNPPSGSVVLNVNYWDNPWFPDVLRTEMEWDRAHDHDKYVHVWEGGYEQHTEARVFKNWRVEEFDTPEGTVFYTGADWGFSVDPSTLVRSFVSDVDVMTRQPAMWRDPISGVMRPRRRLYVDQDLYRIGVEIDHLPTFFDRMDNRRMRQWPIVADSARPETISYLRRHGYPRIVSAKKGPNSVAEGIIFLQEFDIIIHPRCRATIDEFRSYSYKVDPLTGFVLPVLADKKNHIIDPLRYALEQLRSPTAVSVRTPPSPVGVSPSYWRALETQDSNVGEEVPV